MNMIFDTVIKHLVKRAFVLFLQLQRHSVLMQDWILEQVRHRTETDLLLRFRQSQPDSYGIDHSAVTVCDGQSECLWDVLLVDVCGAVN